MVLSAYADDLGVFNADQQDIAALIDITNRFSDVSAAEVNWGKSEALTVGEWTTGLPVTQTDSPGKLMVLNTWEFTKRATTL